MDCRPVRLHVRILRTKAQRGARPCLACDPTITFRANDYPTVQMITGLPQDTVVCGVAETTRTNEGLLPNTS
jgi:hypothetical protein